MVSQLFICNTLKWEWLAANTTSPGYWHKWFNLMSAKTSAWCQQNGISQMSRWVSVVGLPIKCQSNPTLGWCWKPDVGMPIGSRSVRGQAAVSLIGSWSAFSCRFDWQLVGIQVVTRRQPAICMPARTSACCRANLLGICSANRHRPVVSIIHLLAGGPMPGLIGICSACCRRPAIKPTGIMWSGRLLFAAFGPRILPLNAIIRPTSGRCWIVSLVGLMIMMIALKRALQDFFYNLTASQTVSNTYAQLVGAQYYANHVQHIGSSSHATCVPRGTKRQLSS